MSISDWTPERRQEVIDSGKVSPEELGDLMRWEAEQCYLGIGTLRDLAKQTGDIRIKQYADVLDFAVRRRFGWETDYYEKKVRQVEGQQKITVRSYREAWERSRTGTQKDIARELGIDVSTVRRFLNKNPKEKRPNKKRA